MFLANCLPKELALVVVDRCKQPSGLEGELQPLWQGQHPYLSHVKVASFVPLCAPKGQLETSAFLIIKVINEIPSEKLMSYSWYSRAVARS